MEKEHTITLRADEAEISRIRSLAKEAGMTVSDYVRNCVESSLFKNEKAFETLADVINGLNVMLHMADSYHEWCAQQGCPEPSGKFSNEPHKTINPLIDNVREMLSRCSVENL